MPRRQVFRRVIGAFNEGTLRDDEGNRVTDRGDAFAIAAREARNKMEGRVRDMNRRSAAMSRRMRSARRMR